MVQNIINRIFHKLAFIMPGGFSLRPKLHRLRGANIGKNVWISQYVYLDELHPEAVTIKENSTIGIRTSIITHLYWGARKSHGGYKQVVIEKDAFIGPHCLIMPGVRVGEGAVVKGGTVLTSNVPPFTLWGYPTPGPLAKVSVPLTPGHSYEEFCRGLKPIKKKKINNKS